MSQRVKVGVAGVGHMGKEHARIYSELQEAELVGVHDSNPDTARKIAAKCKTRAFGSLEEMVDAVDAASIVTPTTTHLAIAEPFLKRGKHVLVEKPIAMDTEEARKLVDLAEKHGAKLAVGHVERFNPVLVALEERLGRPRFIEAHRLSPYPGRSTDIGVVMDLMIHDLEIILHLVRSPVTSVDAVGVPVLSKGEDIANARIRFANGCVANLTTSRISPEKLRKIRVFQDDAYLSLDYMKQEGEIYKRLDGKITRDKIPVMKGEPLKNQLAEFVMNVRENTDPRVAGAHGFEALKLASQICGQIGSVQP
ncbi:MAG: Gfo/Idh/MocA family oxidoreductase [Candidatus Pacebacteria bacterium]|nr:Gfo/Idh/MocA family oxidoreductase [Candidatus Paceibacterota bacterium]